jgi:hypothetical protein
MSESDGVNPDLRPLDPATGQPRPRTEQPGYYPGYRTLDQRAFWDEATRRKVLERVHNVPEIRFFTKEEARLMETIAGHLLPQDDRHPSRHIPIVPPIDRRLHAGRTPGYRFAKMPPDGEAYRLGFRALEQIARHSYGDRPFEKLSWAEQDELLKSIHDAKPKAGAEDIWKKMEIHRFWALVLQDCLEAYYAHPWAWDEIGFGGPAYPRGYMRLEHGDPEPWEVEEKRYEWEAPSAALSDPKSEEIAAHSKHPAAGQGGTH